VSTNPPSPIRVIERQGNGKVNGHVDIAYALPNRQPIDAARQQTEQPWSTSMRAIPL
jgi:RecA-family ATPase